MTRRRWQATGSGLSVASLVARDHSSRSQVRVSRKRQASSRKIRRRSRRRSSLNQNRRINVPINPNPNLDPNLDLDLDLDLYLQQPDP